MSLAPLSIHDDPERRARLDAAVEIARLVGRKVLMPRLPLGGYRGQLDYKGRIDLVTDADRAAEATIRAEIATRFPGEGVLGEERGESAGTGASRRRWIVDPLDGTTNFVHGHPFFCVSIACADDLGPEVGVVYAPHLDECFFAARGGGAYLNTETIPLRVSAETELIRALLTTGFAYDQKTFPNVQRFARLLACTQGVRRCGAAALDLAFVGAGRYDGFWESGLNAWDVMAGALIVTEAGGRVTDYEGGQDWVANRTIVASNGKIHERLLEDVHAAGE